MRQLHYLLIGFILSIFLFSCQQNHNPNEKFRVVILTDMTHDDGNSLIRYLYYASYFDLEALIVTNQLPDYNYNDDGPWKKAMGILDAYSAELPQLRKHDPELPSYEDLMAVTKPGRGALPIIWLTNTLNFSGWIADRYVVSQWDSIYFHDWIGEGSTPHGEPKDSPGSERLIEVFAKDDDRPIFVQAWGGTITFVQALYRFRQQYGEERFQALLPKLHLFGILFQDISFEYFADFMLMQEKTCAGFGTARPTYDKDPVDLGMVLFDTGHFWQYVWSGDSAWVKPMTAAEVNGHGPLSDIYDDGGEGDTPSFLYLLSGVFGLNDPLNPDQGSWGSLFEPMGEGFPKTYYHTCGVDVKELTRWIPDARNSFENRLLWSVREPGEVNREPVAVINKDYGNMVMNIRAKAGETISLDASGSFDPDDDKLSFNWFRYDEADSYEGDFTVPGNPDPVLTIQIPEDIGNGNIHLILEVRDNGQPSLVNYRRVILNGLEKQPRVFIFTDINIDAGDPDDRQSLVHLLWYADELTIEGIVPDRWDAGGLEACEMVVNEYAKDYNKYSLQIKGYPVPSSIESKLAVNLDDAITRFRKAASAGNGPLYVLVWGNMENVGEALRQCPEYVDNIRVITIGTHLMKEEHIQFLPAQWEKTDTPCTQYNWNGFGRNRIFNDPQFNKLWWLEINWTYEGMFGGSEPAEMLEKLSHFGSLGMHMKEVVKNEPWAQYFRVGDTPTVLYLIDPDNNLSDPTQGSWAGKFVKPFPGERPNYYTDDNGTIPWDYFDPCNTWENHVDVAKHASGSIEKTRPEMYRELLGKLDAIYTSE